jgi:secondary thiamine-phosphate synthase enzyme
MIKLRISSQQGKQVLDITDRINKLLAEAFPEVDGGICALFVCHTTAALTTADLDPGTDQDMLDAFDAMIPKLEYRHPHDPPHVPDHILSSLIGPSLTVPVQDNELALGIWQRVVLIECDGPHERDVLVSVLPAQLVAGLNPLHVSAC